MWQIVNRTPFKAEGYFVRDVQGNEHWVVALRASFDATSNGILEISHRQSEVLLAPCYADDKAEELAADSDIAPFRPKADFTVAGKVVSPGRASFEHQEFSLQVGAFRKDGIAFGRRWLQRKSEEWYWRERELADAVPLSWRMAFGGKDLLAKNQDVASVHDENPIGKGWTPDYSLVLENDVIEIPQIENPACYFHPKLNPSPHPFGLGSVQPSWQSRRILAGTYDQAWERFRAPLFPTDFSNQFFQAAPSNQALDLYGGEPVILKGLHPDGTLQFNLPRTFFRVTTFLGTERPSSRMRLIGVHANTEEMRLEMTWNASVPCNGRDHEVDKAIIMMKQLEGVK